MHRNELNLRSSQIGQTELPDMALVKMVAVHYNMTDGEVLSYVVSHVPHRTTAMYLLLKKKMTRSVDRHRLLGQQICIDY